jgi:branched-chain amino acid transport system ATP-binding protein
MRPLAGSVTLDGTRIDGVAPERIVAMGVSHLPEGRGIFPSLTVDENLRMGAYTIRHDRSALHAGIDRVTDLFPRLRERMQQPAGTLSGGEQQMLALARALLPGPRLLMIDELSLGLAPVVVQQLLKLVQDINAQGTTILLVEQYVNLALRIASRAYVLEKGTVATSGDARTLAGESEAVRSSYLGESAASPRRRSTRKRAPRTTKTLTAEAPGQSEP